MNRASLWPLALLYCGLLGTPALAETENAEVVPLLIVEDPAPAPDFEDTGVSAELPLPNWFKPSFLNLQEDLREAHAKGKDLMLYVSAPGCSYCEQFLKVTLAEADIRAYSQHYFDVVALNALGDIEITTPGGQPMRESEFVHAIGAQYTPTVVFYRYQADGQARRVLRLRGYYEPYVFRAALDYVVSSREDAAYQRFSDYMASVQRPPEGDYQLHSHELFQRPPHNLDRSVQAAQRPLAVLFEQGQCHACDRLHQQYLDEPEILQELEQMDVVQLDIWQDTPVITPSGERLTAHNWAAQLGLFYTPSLVFFDERGQRIFTVDSVVRLNRLRGVLRYIRSKAYLQKDFIRWHREKKQGLH